MRMKKRELEEAGKRFQGAKHAAHNGHIGPGPKPGPKRAVNITVDAEILALAKEMGINLSQTLEAALRKLTEEERVRRWQKENREAIESHNAYFERNGTLSEALLKEAGMELDDPSV